LKEKLRISVQQESHVTILTAKFESWPKNSTTSLIPTKNKNAFGKSSEQPPESRKVDKDTRNNLTKLLLTDRIAKINANPPLKDWDQA
jgi:hypothetical protein